MPLLTAFAAELSTSGVARGLLGPREVPRLWERHLLNCAVTADVAGESASVIDLGSGAGLPGLVWALVRPDLTITLVEPMQRRTRFLAEVVLALNLTDRVKVVRGRAEDLAGELSADVVTSRALAPWSRLAGWSLPLVADGGVVAALKGASAAEELVDAEDALRAAGAARWEVRSFGADVLKQPAQVAILHPRSAPA